MTDHQLYKEKVKAQLEEWEAEMEKMKAQARQEDINRRLDQDKRLQELQIKMSKGRKKLEEMEGSGSEAWGTLKEGMEKAMDDLRMAFKEAWSKFKKPNSGNSPD